MTLSVTALLSPSEQQDMPSIALAIHRALTLGRSPEVFKVEAPIMQQATWIVQVAEN